jgi:hypothetical protein
MAMTAIAAYEAGAQSRRNGVLSNGSRNNPREKEGHREREDEPDDNP